jgi:SSS family solute:Na+ symporter
VLELLDWAVVVIYFAVIFGVAVAVRPDKAHGSASDYFLAGRNVGWFVVGASLFASNIGSEHLVGLAGSGAAGGLAVAQFELLAAFSLILLGWVFVPFYVRSGVFTMPEFLERRFSAGPRLFLAVISVVAYVLTKISVTIAAGGIVFETLMGVPFWWGAGLTVAFTGIYTLVGGLRAVMYTDLVQTFVLLAGAIAVTVLGLDTVGGWNGLRASLPVEYFSVWKPTDHPDYPWSGIVLGAPILAVWYWCTDQFIVQRVLSARSVAEARRGTLFAAFLKQLPLFIFVLPGLIAIALANDDRFILAESDQALPALVGALLPAGCKGLVAAGLLAALMSSLSSVFNSCSTLISMDLYRKLVPSATDRGEVNVGRIAVLVLVVFGVAWIPMTDLVSGRLYTYLQSIQAYLSPPIAAVFLLAILWPRGNSVAAMTTLVAGALVGVVRLVLEVNKADLTGVLYTYADINFLHFAFASFAFCVVLFVAVSLLSAPPRAEQVEGLTLSHAGRETRADDRARRGRNADSVVTLVLVGLVAFLWWLFSPLALGG